MAAGAATAAPTPAPKLVVTIAVDQFSGSLFDEWRGRFTDGMRRLAGGVEALTGILMCGWSTAFFFAIVSNLHEQRTRRNN